jgi:hypothetical protein
MNKNKTLENIRLGLGYIYGFFCIITGIVMIILIIEAFLG